MKGGPSHVDLLDYKPELAKANGKTTGIAEKFGGAPLIGPVHPFSQHGKSGLWLSTLMPKLAEHADDLCVINSMHTDVPNHSPAFVQMHTGSFQFVRPSMGAWVVYGLGLENDNLLDSSLSILRLTMEDRATMAARFYPRSVRGHALAEVSCLRFTRHSSRSSKRPALP